MSRKQATRLSGLNSSGSANTCPCRPPKVTGLYIPPRGPPPAAQKLGYLTNKNNTTVLVLYGNPTHYGSNVYSYYVDIDGAEVPVKGPDNRPLYTNDTVYVPGRNGVWSVNLYAHGSGFYTYE